MTWKELQRAFRDWWMWYPLWRGWLKKWTFRLRTRPRPAPVPLTYSQLRLPPYNRLIWLMVHKLATGELHIRWENEHSWQVATPRGSFSTTELPWCWEEVPAYWVALHSGIPLDMKQGEVVITVGRDAGWHLYLRRGVMLFTDLYTYKEVWVDEVYAVDSSFLSANIQYILDIGAFIGESALWFAYRFPQAVIHAYEPSPQNFVQLKRNIEANRLTDRIHVFEEALSDQEGSITLEDSPLPDCGLRVQALSCPPESTVRVPAITLARALERLGGTAHLAKLDCEGAEFAIIGASPPQLLRKVTCWLIEYHRDPAPLINKLQEASFTVHILRETSEGIFKTPFGVLLAYRKPE